MATPGPEAAPADLVVLRRSSEVRATVHLYGATVISWKCKGEERIFVSSTSHFDNKKAIRGGIPIAFPQFGPWDLGPQHGFARISRWSLQQSPTWNKNADLEAKFELVDNGTTRAMWNHRFRLIYTVILMEDSLFTELSVANTGNDPFSFTCLLHTYFAVPDILDVAVSGLDGASYIDKLKGGAEEKESRELVRISEATDRIYIWTAVVHDITNTAGGDTLTLVKKNFPETVVWNPWKEKAEGMADFDDDGYTRMICVEAGRIQDPKTLAPGETFTASQKMSV